MWTVTTLAISMGRSMPACPQSALCYSCPRELDMTLSKKKSTPARYKNITIQECVFVFEVAEVRETARLRVTTNCKGYENDLDQINKNAISLQRLRPDGQRSLWTQSKVFLIPKLH